MENVDEKKRKSQEQLEKDNTKKQRGEKPKEDLPEKGKQSDDESVEAAKEKNEQENEQEDDKEEDDKKECSCSEGAKKDPPSVLQNKVRQATIELDMACTEGYLVDLHSHLMGMGDATFWTNLMCDYIPSQVSTRTCTFYLERLDVSHPFIMP
jgi:hypothetical protein